MAVPCTTTQPTNPTPGYTQPRPPTHLCLVVCRCGEDLGLLGGDGGVATNQLSHHAAQGLDAQRQRGHVQQQDVLHVAAQHAALQRSSNQV